MLPIGQRFCRRCNRLATATMAHQQKGVLLVSSRRRQGAPHRLRVRGRGAQTNRRRTWTPGGLRMRPVPGTGVPTRRLTAGLRVVKEQLLRPGNDVLLALLRFLRRLLVKAGHLLGRLLVDVDRLLLKTGHLLTRLLVAVEVVDAVDVDVEAVLKLCVPPKRHGGSGA